MSSDLRIDLGPLIAYRCLPLAADAQARKLNICSGGTKLTVCRLCKQPSDHGSQNSLAVVQATIHTGSTMIEGGFDERVIVNMSIALDRVCEHTPHGEEHDVRKRIAQGIVRCARSGKTTVGALTDAGERALVRVPGERSDSARLPVWR
jgi:hypothetical protein